MISSRRLSAAAILLVGQLSFAVSAVAQPPTSGPVPDNPAWYHWLAGYPSDYYYVTTNDSQWAHVQPATVPVVDTSVPLDWHNPNYWMDVAASRDMPFPPNERATWFIGGDENPDTDDPNVTVVFSQDRDGNNGTGKVGAFAIGGGNSDQITTLIISANMSTTGQESASGNPIAPNRPIRIGRSDSVFEDTSYDSVNGFNKAAHKIPWGVVKHTTGLLEIDHRNLDNTPNAISDLRIQSDKDWISGAIYEIGGDARLRVGDTVQIGDRGENTTFDGVTLGHGIFRVRGSNVQEISVGTYEQDTTPFGGDFTVMSGAGRADSGRISYDAGTTFFTQVNGGKSIVEFVLDEGGVTPIEVSDELRIGRNNHASFFAGDPNPVLYGFMRIKLMAPTTAGSGAVGSGDDLVLFRADRITSAITGLGGSQLEEGRFMDPDRDLPGVFPHRPLLEGGTVIADYAGATYTWTINYFDDITAPTGDGIIEDTVVLSNLVISGTPGDLDGVGGVTPADRALLAAAVAAPPADYRDLIGGAQHLFDLNADDVIDALDLAVFDTYFLAPVGLAGDYNGDGFVNAADYTVWRNNLGTNFNLNGNGNETGGSAGVVDAADYTWWKQHYGDTTPGAGGLAGGVVPEPGSIVLALFAACAVLATGRRGHVAA